MTNYHKKVIVHIPGLCSIPWLAVRVWPTAPDFTYLYEDWQQDYFWQHSFSRWSVLLLPDKASGDLFTRLLTTKHWEKNIGVLILTKMNLVWDTHIMIGLQHMVESWFAQVLGNGILATGQQWCERMMQLRLFLIFSISCILLGYSYSYSYSFWATYKDFYCCSCKENK